MHPLYSTALLLHLVGFAGFAGAAFAQQQFLRASAAPGLDPRMRDDRERLAAAIVTRIQLPMIFLSVLSGLTILFLKPSALQLPGMHAKLTLVGLLLVLAHLEMFNARRLVRARAAQGDGASGEIAGRKARHAAYGTIGALMFTGVLVIVAFFVRG